VLKIKPGATLSRVTAGGIAAVVARSVEGLTPDQVTLLDTNGHVLLDPKGADAGAVPSTQLEYKREYEAYLASKAEDILTQVVGPGRAVVRVTADINFKSETTTKETYDLDQKAIKKETVQTRTSTGATPGASTAARGPAGTASNLGKPAPAPVGAGKENEENSDVEYYTPPKTVQQQVEAAGGVDRLTVAVMVDREAVPSLSLTDIQDITKEAVGYKQGRDEIKATDAKLAGPAALTGVDAEIQENQRWQNYATLAKNASLGITAVVGLIVLGGVYWLYGRRKAGPVKVETSASTPPEYADALQSLSAQARQDPEALARLLAAWLGEAETPARKAA
jgi:flagellar M-ring protein FliF